MTIEMGIAVKTIDDGERFVETTTVTIVRKTQGNYVEILANKSYEVADNGETTVVENTNDFAVFVGKTVEQVLSINGIYGNYTWTAPMAEVV